MTREQRRNVRRDIRDRKRRTRQHPACHRQVSLPPAEVDQAYSGA